MSTLRDLFSFPTGSVTTNLEASALWVLPTWLVVWRKRTCRVPWCFRLGHHPVAGTTYKVCHHHHRREHHERLLRLHRLRHPDRLGWGDSHDS